MERPLSQTQQEQAQQLAQAITQAAQDEFLHIAQLLVAADDATLFGATEFQVRDAILRVAATAYEQHLASKKTATRAPA